MNTSHKNISVIKSGEFSAEHFDAFKNLDLSLQSRLLSCISLDLFASACCLITDKDYLHKLCACLTKVQTKWLKKSIYKKQALIPSPIFITRIQKMIIYLHTMFTEVIYDVDEFKILSNYSISDCAANNQQPATTFEHPHHIDEQNVNLNTDNEKYQETSKTLFCEKSLAVKIETIAKKDQDKFQQILNIGSLRKLYYPAQSSLAELDMLAKHFPNFNPMIKLIKSSIQVNLLGKTPFELPIINLQGKPGCGKTCFVKALAKALRVEFFSINVGSMHGRLELVGGNKQYSDADLGAVGQIMCLEAKTFQPLILLDELCQARDNSSDSVIQPLYALFDREQRKTFKEHYLELNLDLSGTLIITTTNNFENLKPALKSRLVNINIAPPTIKQMQIISQNIYTSTITELALGFYFSDELPQPVRVLLSTTLPRIAKEQLRLAIGQACSRAQEGQQVLLSVDDFNNNRFDQYKKKKSKDSLITEQTDKQSRLH